MPSQIKRTRKAVDVARKHFNDLLDLAGVPDGSEESRKATKAFIGLEEILEEVPKSARNVKALFAAGPVVYPVSGRDPRQWPTSKGVIARKLGLVPRKIGKARVAMPKNAAPSRRRVLAGYEYTRALENAEPVVSNITSAEDPNSFTLIQLSRDTFPLSDAHN